MINNVYDLVGKHNQLLDNISPARCQESFNVGVGFSPITIRT